MHDESDDGSAACPAVPDRGEGRLAGGGRHLPPGRPSERCPRAVDRARGHPLPDNENVR